MGFVKNFDRTITVTNGQATVRGSSDDLVVDEVEIGDLVSRNVVIQQGSTHVAGAASHDTKWSSDSLEAGALVHGTAVAIGTEVWAVHADQNPGAISTTLTLTWFQEVTIEIALPGLDAAADD